MRDTIRRFRLQIVTLVVVVLALAALRAWGGRPSSAALAGADRPASMAPGSAVGLTVDERAKTTRIHPPVHLPSSEAPALWVPDAGSPVRLFEPETWESWAPTKESCVRWYSSVPEFEDFDAEQWDAAWALPKFQSAWETIREHQALRLFIITYEEREQARWDQHRTSIALEEEIRPVSGFIDREFGADGELWDAISSFSGEVVDRLWMRGEDADRGAGPASKEDVRSLLTLHSSAPFRSTSAFDTVARILRGLRPR